MGWLIAVGFVVALGLLPLGLSLRYDAEGLKIYALAGGIRIPISGKKEEKKIEKKKKTARKRKKATASPSSGQPKTKKKGGTVTDFLPLLQIVLDFLDAFRWKLRIRRLQMKLIMAADDPCDLAVNYGRAWAALGNLIPLLERSFLIKKRDLQVECDFEATQPLITARLDLSITVGRLLRILLRYGLRAIQEFLKLKKSKKGGALK